MKQTLLAAFGCLGLCTTTFSAPPVPNLISYQGRVTVGNPPVNFNSPPDDFGYFKFALVKGTGSTILWKNSKDTAPQDGEPDDPISLEVTNGLYSVLLGDDSIPKMDPIPVSVWLQEDVRLRVWFSDGTNGFQRLDPDQRLAPGGFLPEGVVTAAKLADGAVSAAKLTDGAVTSEKIAAGLTLNGTTTGTFAGSGTGLSGLTAGSISGGTLADARLSSNVALRSGGNTFTGNQFVGGGALALTGTGPFDTYWRNGATTTLTIGIAGTFGQYSNSVTAANEVVLRNEAGQKLHLQSGTGDAAITITANNSVGMGTTWPEARLHVAGDIKLGTDANQRTVSSSGRMAVQAGEFLYLNPFVGGSDVIVGGGGAATNLQVLGQIVSHGITTTEAFGPDNAFVGTPGNYIAFGHAGTSEDFIGYKNNTFYFRDSPTGADESQPNVVVGGELFCVAVNITSDRHAKEQFKPVNAREVLDKVARLPITEWQYKEQSDARHIGPMAQDFREAFALGHDEKHITSVDADGVALAAIQGLNQKLEEQTREKDRRIQELERSVEELKTLVKRLAHEQSGGEK